MEESPASPPMNTTSTIDANAADTNATTATEEEGGEAAIGGQQQQTTPTIPPNPLFE